MIPKLILTIERWRFNKEYGVYVSTEGRIRDKNKKFKKILMTRQGYCKINIGDKTVLIHRLVLKTWKPVENSNNLTVDHINHNKRDNSLKNLEWVSKKENQRRAKEDLFLGMKYTPKTPDESEELVDTDVIYVNNISLSREAAFNFIKSYCKNQNFRVTEGDVEKAIIKAINGKNNNVYCGFKITRG